MDKRKALGLVLVGLFLVSVPFVFKVESMNLLQLLYGTILTVRGGMLLGFYSMEFLFGKTK